MPRDLGWKNLRLKWRDIQVRTRGELTALIWKNKRDIHMLTNVHDARADSNFCDDNGNALKPATVEDYNRHMGYVDRGGQ